MKIIVLGSGTSNGVPVVGCDCPVCASADPRDKRTRASVYIKGAGGEAALIDAGPEFRLQAIRAGITRLDGIFLTHSHADHIHGLDDIRSLTRDNPLPVYGNESTIEEMKERFSYIWRKTQKGGGKPNLIPKVVSPPDFSAPVQIGALNFAPVPVKHGVLDILGWEVWEERPGENTRQKGKTTRFLYLTDTSAIPQATWARFSAPGHSRIIIIGALRARPHETHFTFEEAMNAALSLGAEKTYLTHICHSHSHREIEEICLNFTKTHTNKETACYPAYDGLELNV